MSLKNRLRQARRGLHSARENFHENLHELKGIVREGRGLINDIPITVRPPSGDFGFGFNMGSSRKRKGRKTRKRQTSNILLDIAEQGW